MLARERLSRSLSVITRRLELRGGLPKAPQFPRRKVTLKLPPLRSLISVNWIDTTTYSGWRHHNPERPVNFSPRRMTTVGFLMGSNPVGIYVVPTLSSPDAESSAEGHLDGLVLPRGCIVSLRELPT